MVRVPRPLLLACAALGLASLASTVAAQPVVIQSDQLGGYGLSADPTMLLRMPQIQRELELVDDQKARLKEIGDELRQQTRDQWKGLQNLSPEERQAKVAKMREDSAKLAAEARKKIDAVLLPHQSKRLEQISLQMKMRWRGLNGIAANPEIIKQLELDPKQQEKLKEIAEQTQQKLRELPQKIMEEGRQKALEVLTPEQRKKLEDAIGEKFELNWSQGQGGAETRPVIIRRQAIQRIPSNKGN